MTKFYPKKKNVTSLFIYLFIKYTCVSKLKKKKKYIQVSKVRYEIIIRRRRKVNYFLFIFFLKEKHN